MLNLEATRVQAVDSINQAFSKLRAQLKEQLEKKLHGVKNEVVSLRSLLDTSLGRIRSMIGIEGLIGYFSSVGDFQKIL